MERRLDRPNYSIWSTEPSKLDAEWRAFFEGFELAQTATPVGRNGTGTPIDEDQTSKQARAIGLIYAYRSNGHTIAKVNPLAKERPTNPRLTLERLGFSEADLDRSFHTGNYLGGVEMTLRELIESV